MIRNKMNIGTKIKCKSRWFIICNAYKLKINQLKKMTILKYKTQIKNKDIENIDTGMYKFFKVYFLNGQIFEKKHVRWNKKIINLCNNIKYITKN